MMSATTVPAIEVNEIGGPEVLELTEIDVPEPGPGQLAVGVGAAGVNFIDIYQRSGVYPMALPHVPGSEGAGSVLAVGAGVDDVAVGDRVAWESLPGSYAAVVAGPADRVVPIPDGVSVQQAAAVMLQGVTAHYLAHDSYRISDGDTVLVHAGAGGVGLLLTQIAVLRGARVITTVSTAAKAELSTAAGAAEVLIGYDDVDGRVRDLTGGAGVHAVYDGVGKDTFDASLASLRPRGTLALFGAASGQVPPFDILRLNSGGSLFLTRPTLGHHLATREELLWRAGEVLGAVADGSLHVAIGGRYPLTEAATAFADLEGRRTQGKLLLIP